MKRKVFFVLCLICIFLFTPVNAKEEKYKIVSGDLETIDSEICFDTECFYVLGNDGNVLRLLGKYNITVEDNPVQSADAEGIEFTDEPYWGKTERQDAKYVYNSNSSLYKYVEAYKDYMIEKGVVVSNARLVNQEELYLGGVDVITYTWPTPKVRFNSNFWAGVAYDDEDVWTSELEQAYYTNDHFGICPVLEIPVGWFSEEGTIYNGSINKVNLSDGIISNSDTSVDLKFNDLGQEAKYQTTIYNTTGKNMYVNDISFENISEAFISVRLDTKSENMLIEPNGSSLVTFYVKTLKEEGAGRNFDEDLVINFRVSDKIYNPNTFSNILEFIILLGIFGCTMYFVKRNKKLKGLAVIGFVSLLGITYVSAKDFTNVSVSAKIKYESQNNIIATGTVLNDMEADYTNSKEVWSYYDKVKNVEVKSLINKPKKYYKDFDLTENKTGRVKAYLIENGDKDIPYDLVIMSNGVVIANSDSSFMFSFPNTEKVDGLSNIDFRGATTMQGMFIGNEKLVSVDTKSIEMDNTTNTSFMFYNCSEIEHDRDDFNLENVNNDDYMIPHSLYNTVKKDAVSDKDENFDNKVVNTGKYFMKDTKDDKFPIYYYRGDIKNNNVVFGGLCWKIVRTTDTGGTKLIYNGKVNDNGSCENTSFDDDIKSVIYNYSFQNMLALGYMYSGNEYITENGYIKKALGLIDDQMMANRNYYYSDNVEYVDGKYKLIDAKLYSWKDNYENLVNKFWCQYTSNATCSRVYYILSADSSYSYNIELKDADMSVDKYIYLSNKYIKDSDGYKLDKPQKIKYSDWLFHENDYLDYFVCDDLQSIKCQQLYSIVPHHMNGYVNLNPINIVYGNSVIYKDGKYVLKDTFVSDNYSEDFEKIGEKYHYTCGNNSGECEKVRYIVATNSTYYDYYEFSDGTTLDLFLDEFHNNYSVDSYVKEYVDLWYANKISNYSSYFEDTVWCNDKSRKSEGFLSINSNVRELLFLTDYRFDNNLISVSCKNKGDAFTVSNNTGNGALTYPVGLLTVDELVMAGLNKGYGSDVISYLSASYAWWTMSPAYTRDAFIAYGNSISSEYFDGGDGYYPIYMRPSISLKNSLKYVTGNGTANNPYVIE